MISAEQVVGATARPALSFHVHKTTSLFCIPYTAAYLRPTAACDSNLVRSASQVSTSLGVEADEDSDCISWLNTLLISAL